MGNAWRGIYARGGGRDVLRLALLLPNSGAGLAIAESAMFEAQATEGLIDLAVTESADTTSGQVASALSVAAAVTEAADVGAAAAANSLAIAAAAT